MPLRLIDPSKPVRWTHPSEKKSKDATVFNILPLTEGKSREFRLIFKSVVPSSEEQNEFMRRMFLECIPTIENALLPGETSARTLTAFEDRDKFYNCLLVELAKDIYSAIQNAQDLDAGTLKN